MLLIKVNKEDILKGLTLKIEELKTENKKQYDDSKRLLAGLDEEKECFLNRINDDYSLKIEELRKKKAIVENTEEHYLTLNEILENCILKDKL